ncbi:AraC family transcriptional regulator [Glycomyces arizonensis]|uniref:AraC family transcriptional regulator n=1 Tax=Glycomyces arizonensis TaxID=256035 RepID=UPI000426E024|nr:AraC family transcriptional regulator [Glycomyces arizonensis]
MVGDHLSKVLELVEVRGVVSGGFAVRGPWVSRAVIDDPMKFLALVSGRARLTADGLDAPMELGPGDVAILNNRSRVELEGGEGDGPRREVVPHEAFAAELFEGADRRTDAVLIGGHAELNPAGRALLSRALPPVAHVRASAAEANHLQGLLDRLFEEAAGSRMGSAFAIRQYGQLLLLEVLRAYAGQAELPPGWLRVLTDERLRPALGLMHAEPGRAWGLEALARAAAMSRTSFAERFRTVAGVPPLTYLNRWRMLLAQQALRDADVRVGSLASELGYGSESAFSTAFKREVGESPLRYRLRMRGESTRPASADADRPLIDADA